ncbi:SRC kinase signaling inhibitor 1 isoform X8 [Brienomyrus brachyistius]|uniref:SRC kinase signaling inhibitor 1 isoform X8 n=1 Tax=Brienomyrus brachyistius TaxID=42636 RepID=UPI0020B44B41|nr:SRC kinase signaling inhibitor 1 isoform X8 [Brienomyrus brachyistius]
MYANGRTGRGCGETQLCAGFCGLGGSSGFRVSTSADAAACFPKQDAERGGGHMISTDDAEYPREYRTLANGARRFSNVGLVHTSEHRHTVIAAQSLEALTGLPKADMERKRDAFMDHLKNKYPPSPSPSHGSMRGAPDRIREQPNYWSFKVSASRSPRHSQSTQSGLADQAAKLSFASAESLETMSEADIPLGFNRMNRFRQSLPLSRSASQTKLRSPGVLFLQFGDETRRVHITHELGSLDTLHALILHMFPQKLTAGMLKSPNTAILIKDEARNVFYELEDVRDIQDRSVIKIYRKEPIYASYPAAHLANGDLRREMVYASRESSPTRRLASMPSSASPTSGSPSRSRLSYAGGRPPSFTGQGHPQLQPPPSHGHHHGMGHPPGSGLSPSPSAILERRDVKPDEEVSGKSVALLKSEGLYADPYGLVHEGRLSIASTQALATIGDPFGFPVAGGLYRRGSVRSLSTYSAAALQGEMEDALYKPGGPLYPDSYSSTLGTGFRLGPSSPQKMSEMQLRGERDSYSGPPSRASPVRQTFRKDSSSVFVESPKSRPGSSSEPLCGPGGLGGDGGRGTMGFNSPLAGNETETRERMEAMEKQIASLTGLVQSVLTRPPDSDSTCSLLRLCMMAGCPPQPGLGISPPCPFSSSEKTESTSDGSATGTQTPSAPLALMPPPPRGATQATTVTRLQMQLHLHDLRQNASDLRDQLSQLRKMQLQNQDLVRSLLKRTEMEISLRVTDALRKQEDPLQRQRLLVEEERLKYLNEEELVIQQLHDLEKSVEEIQKNSSVDHRLVTSQELEEKAMVLRKLGETLTELKSQFPGLQSKMRVVLRVEVEAVKFLKEEPHRLDALLKRCKSITDTLAILRRQVSEGISKGQGDIASSLAKHAEDFSKSTDFDIPTSPPLNDLGGGSSLANWTPLSGSSHGNPSAAMRDPHPPVPLKSRALEELSGRRSGDKSVSVEVRLAAERDWEEKRASLTQYSAQDINRLLEETQAELMKAIPDLDFAAKQIKPSAPPGSQSGTSTPEHRLGKPQNSAQKLSSKDVGSRRGSDELTVARYRTEKPSKSPPPPPPRRSFPSSQGISLCRSGDAVGSSKSIKKSESEEMEVQKPHIKLRRAVSEAQRPASTPPDVAAGGKDEDDDEKAAIDPEESVGGSSIQTSSDHNASAQLSECVPALSSQTDTLVGAGLQGGHGEVGRDSETSRVCWAASGRLAPQHQSPKDGRRLRRQDSLETIEKEELALVVTDRQLKVSPRNEAQELIRKNKQPLRIMSIPTHKPGGPCEIYYLRDNPSGPFLSSAPLFVLFKEPLEVKEAYRCLEALLDEEGEAETVGSESVSSGSKIKLPRKQLAILRKATRQGAETRCRTLSLCPDIETQVGGTCKNVERTSDRLAAPVESQPKATLLHGSQAEDIRSSTYRRLDSLEETIRQLETTLQEIGAHPACSFLEQGTDEIATVAFETSHSPDKKKPPIPPKPTGVPAVITKGGGSGKGLHSSASSRLKHLQQGAPEKGKTSRLREDFLKSQGHQQQ